MLCYGYILVKLYSDPSGLTLYNIHIACLSDFLCSFRILNKWEDALLQKLQMLKQYENRRVGRAQAGHRRVLSGRLFCTSCTGSQTERLLNSIDEGMLGMCRYIL